LVIDREAIGGAHIFTMEHEIVLSTEGVTKCFGDRCAVDNVTMAVPQGETLGILGANGAGKTTLLHMLLGAVRPTKGHIHVFGLNLEHHRVDILRRMNFVSINVNLPMNLRVWENLVTFARLYGVNDPWRRVDELLELMEISHLKNALTGALSSGETTRLNLCKALINRPELLLLDEPTANLDPDIAEKVRTTLKRLCDEEGTTILYTSHNMHDVEEICHRVVFLHKGRLVASGSPKELVARYESRDLEELFIHIVREEGVAAS